MNRQKAMTYIAAGGVIFLLFYWTHLGFTSAGAKAEKSLRAVENRIEKAVDLAGKIKTGSDRTQTINTGLLSFLQTSAEREGLGGKLGGIRPKTVPGAEEAATIRLDGLNYNELVSFLRSVERYGNLSLTNTKISKRFDNEQLLNLVADVIKK